MALKVGLDSGFFVRLLDEDPTADSIFSEIVEGKVRAVVSTVTLHEVERLALKGAVQRDLWNKLLAGLRAFVDIVPLDEELALISARISHGTGLPTADAVVYATCLNCDLLYTTDKDLLVVQRKKPRIVLI